MGGKAQERKSKAAKMGSKASEEKESPASQEPAEEPSSAGTESGREESEGATSLVVIKTEPESAESTAGSEHGGDGEGSSSSDNPPIQSATLPPRYKINFL
ncbi:unnamed protein product [Orchesella dallaii]|uniref:Uncharacterized protein n=1 Tax=Orchesella dallaii TaxID=48710 RepID=A0ABP1R2R2_9HEXA